MSALKTDEEIKKLLEHENNALKSRNHVEVKIIGSGNHGNQSRGEDTKNPGSQLRSKESQAVVAVTAELIGTTAAAELLGTSTSAASSYRHGMNADRKPDAELQRQIDEKIGKVNKKVADKVDLLLDLLDEEKMLELKAAEIPSSAEKLVNIYDKINRRNDKNLGGESRPQVILYAPKQINVEQYITKEV